MRWHRVTNALTQIIFCVWAFSYMRIINEAVKRTLKLSKDEIIINVSGRGDKDVAAIADYLEAKK